MNNKLKEIDNILNDLYSSVKDNSIQLNYKAVYNYLIKRSVPKDQMKCNFNDVFTVKMGGTEKYFSEWIERFAGNKNIDVFCADWWKYFCQFKSKNNISENGQLLKVYVPLDNAHIFEGANLIFDFLSNNDINHISKISSEVRFDDVVIRLYNVQDAMRLKDFINSSDYIMNGLIGSNCFAFSNNGISYAYDGNLSYNMIVSKLIANYIDSVKEKKNANVSLLDFYNYIQEYVNSYNKSVSLLDDDEREYDQDVYLILKLISLSMNSNDMKDFVGFYNYANSEKSYVDFVNFKNEKNLDSSLDYKELLFDEVILAMMKKYPVGHYDKYDNLSGLHYIISYINGNNVAITRDNGLRNKVVNNLSGDDIKEIVISSGVDGSNFNDKLKKYIDIVMFKDIINSMMITHPERLSSNINSFINSGDSNYITRFSMARILSKNLSGDDIREIFNYYGVNDIDEYISKYINNVGNERRMLG